MQHPFFNPDNYTEAEGVLILSPVTSKFEDIYLKVREKEKRIYTDAELLLLPNASNFNPHKNEWDLRAKSFQRFKEYLKTKKQNLNILDLGCGNGWFCGQLSRSFEHNFYSIDINLPELKQGRKVFISDKMKFIYADIFNAELPNAFFDIITMNAAVQYFPDLKRLLERFLTLINHEGEVHVLDSPFYSNSDAVNAKKRTMDYYSSIGFSEMAENYYHHTWDELSNFNYNISYNPRSFLAKITNIFVSDSPFPWIVVNK